MDRERERGHFVIYKYIDLYSNQTEIERKGHDMWFAMGRRGKRRTSVDCTFSNLYITAEGGRAWHRGLE